MSACAASTRVKDFIDLCLREGTITDADVTRSERLAALQGQRIDRVLNQLGMISDPDFVASWAKITGLPTIEEDRFPDEPVLEAELGAAFLRHAQVLPIKIEGDRLILASSDPLDTFAVGAVTLKTGMAVQLGLARPQDLQKALERLYATPEAEHDGLSDAIHGSTASDLERLRDLASDAPVIKMVQTLVERAVEAKASDIHLTVHRRGPIVKLRVDGVLRELKGIVPLQLYDPVVSRIKIMAGLDIAERRLPQDGAARIVAAGLEIDLRVSTMPHVWGEGVVVRILDRSTTSLDLETLGLSDRFVRDLADVLSQPNGLVLMTGPTGSGKTTTLYAALKTLVRPDRNLITIEDPVEYQLDGVTQIEINHRIGFTFASALRAALRQDPDVILVGEIRDGETASIASRAALTGHLVLASVHTNSAAAALPRLIDMGIEPYLLASTVKAVIAQRLVRRVCQNCGQTAIIEGERLRNLGLTATPGRFVTGLHGAGCAQCSQTGFSGRIAVTEFMRVTGGLKTLIANRASTADLTSAAAVEGMASLADHGLDLIAAGRTTVGELERVLGTEG